MILVAQLFHIYFLDMKEIYLPRGQPGSEVVNNKKESTVECEHVFCCTGRAHVSVTKDILKKLLGKLFHSRYANTFIIR